MVQCDKAGVKKNAIILTASPTDTVYGIECEPYNDKTVKHRIKENPLDATEGIKFIREGVSPNEVMSAL